MLKINDVVLNFDILKYLHEKEIPFHMIGDNAQMLCPFHKDSRPSFGLSTRTGVYNCFAGSCKAKGNIVNFIQKIEGFTTYDEAEWFLKSRYGINVYETDGPLELDFGDAVGKSDTILVPEATLIEWDFRHPYLAGRGIDDVWQRRFRIGYDRQSGAITIPWLNRHGECVGVKKRSVTGKSFWVYKLGELGPNRLTFFGINHVYRRKEKSVLIVESEIDAIWAWPCGFPAIAMGTSAVTRAQLDELKNTWVEEVIIASDNDDAGRKAAEQLAAKLTWIPSVKQVDWSIYPDKKDLNDLSPEQIRILVQRSKPVFTVLFCNDL